MPRSGHRTRVLILGAAGRDFHNFNVVYRDDPSMEVVAFTAAQIPGIAGRRYPPALSGPIYPDGIPILSEGELEALIVRHSVDRVVFAYSDVRHEEVMHLASRALAAGADFALLGPARTMLRAAVPVVADVIVAGMPIDLAALMTLNKPVVRARYEFAELERPGLWDSVEAFLQQAREQRA